jgi:hypothetical protein
MNASRLRWSVMVSFEVEGESVELALEAVKRSLADFPRPITSVCLNESRPFGSVSI